MITGAMIELIIEFTNVIHKSPHFNHQFTSSIEAEEDFDRWQTNLIRLANLVQDTWYEDGESCEIAIDAFRKSLEIYIPSINH